MSSEGLIRYGILGFRWINYLSQGYILLRQYSIYKTVIQVPNELREIFPPETFKKARLYQKDIGFNLICGQFTAPMIDTLLIWWLDGIYHMWEYAGFVVKTFGFQQNELMQSVVYVFLANTLSLLLQFMDDYAYHFLLEEEYGFNRQTLKFFIIDELKRFILIQSVSIPFTTGLVYITKTGGSYFVLYLWLYTTASIIFGVIIYPEFIAPLFDNYTPLPDGELKRRIEQLAATVGFPAYKIYVVEESKRSAHTNAYFTGLYKNKRLVLYDTLLKDYTPIRGNNGGRIVCDDDEVLGIVAHELGHWKLNHMWKLAGVAQANLLFLFLGFGVLFKYDALYHAFGFRKEKPALIGFLIVFDLVFSPYNALLNFCTTCLTRRFEFQADAFAKTLGKDADLRRALINVEKANLSFPVYDRFYSMLYNSHPPLLECLTSLNNVD